MSDAFTRAMDAMDAVRLQCTIHPDERITITKLQAQKLHEHGVAHPGEDCDGPCYTLADGKGWLDVEPILGGSTQFVDFLRQ